MACLCLGQRADSSLQENLAPDDAKCRSSQRPGLSDYKQDLKDLYTSTILNTSEGANSPGNTQTPECAAGNAEDSIALLATSDRRSSRNLRLDRLLSPIMRSGTSQMGSFLDKSGKPAKEKSSGRDAAAEGWFSVFDVDIFSLTC